MLPTMLLTAHGILLIIPYHSVLFVLFVLTYSVPPSCAEPRTACHTYR